jgi:hypothetical protein
MNCLRKSGSFGSFRKTFWRSIPKITLISFDRSPD